MTETKGKRPWRTPESFAAEKDMRALVKPFLESRGYTRVEQSLTSLAGGESQIIDALSPAGGSVRLRVRSCWRWGQGGRKPGVISASQLTARFVNSFEATLDNVIRRNQEAKVTHLLLVQSDGVQIVFAASVPVPELRRLWEKQRDVSTAVINAGDMGRIRKNHAENGDSPTLWLMDNRAPGGKIVADVLWNWPGVVDIVGLPKTELANSTSPKDLLLRAIPEASSGGNPDWTRDELILALDLYFRVPAARGSKSHPACKGLSEILNKLPIHTEHPRSATFRNANGVGMKLSNFLRFDPTYTGTGLPSGSKGEKEVWETFAHDLIRLESAAKAIVEGASTLAAKGILANDDDEGSEEGRILTRLHKVRERNPTLTRKKKQLVLKSTGSLKCEICLFDFKHTYGEHGTGFAECHHGKPISEMISGTKTRMSDLHIVCANCHRMLHFGKTWLSVLGLRKLFEENNHIYKTLDVRV